MCGAEAQADEACYPANWVVICVNPPVPTCSLPCASQWKAEHGAELDAYATWYRGLFDDSGRPLTTKVALPPMWRVA